WGSQVKNHALTYGNKAENLIVTGSPRHDNFFRSIDKGKSKGIILFATTGVTGRISYGQTHLDAYTKFESFVREVCRIAKNFPDKQLVVKPHPQPDYISNITKIIKEIDPTIPILYNANLIELINSCDVLITFNNSTVVLESMILGRPAISLQIEKWAEEDEIVKSNALLSISKIEEIENGIKKILYDKEYQNRLVENSKIFVNDYFANHGVASHEVTKLLDSF
ncbi:MAG TPA: UDP-N-acetylglucosamine 2-epimerase, partial [Nitrosopumilaceae archaeon]|nr:UDP-N-acetylglucosamine 2-epimerase [Nitrosopumilaceae archaeon]